MWETSRSPRWRTGPPPNGPRKPAETLALRPATGEIPTVSSRFWRPAGINSSRSTSGRAAKADALSPPRVPSPDAARRAHAEARCCRGCSRVQGSNLVQPAGVGSDRGEPGDVQWRRPLAAPVGVAHQRLAGRGGCGDRRQDDRQRRAIIGRQRRDQFEGQEGGDVAGVDAAALWSARSSRG